MTHSVLSSLSLSSSSSLTSSGNCDIHSCVGSSHHRQAQRLNNTAALCIEMGGRQHYQTAISILTQALRFSGEEPEQQDEVVCTCHYCSIDGCIVSNDEDYNGNTTTEMNEDNSDGSTIDENPIYVYEGHHMGSTLTYIIAFNLAIAHHLTAMEMAHDEEKNADVVKQEKIIINKALQFYELAYDCNLTNTCSMRFDMIICNNLSHIYRHQEQQQQQQHVVEPEPQEEQIQVQLPQETPPGQSQAPSIIIIDDDDENEDEEDISFEYYSQQEEEEEYEHNSTLVSLLTTRSTISSSYTGTSSTTPTSTNHDLLKGVYSHQYSILVSPPLRSPK